MRWCAAPSISPAAAEPARAVAAKPVPVAAEPAPVAPDPAPVAAEVEKYLASDLLFYRAERPHGLVERQAAHWDPILAWTREKLGAHFAAGEGVVHITQSQAALAAARAGAVQLQKICELIFWIAR